MAVERSAGHPGAGRDLETYLPQWAVSYTIAAEPRGVFRIARRPLAARARTLIEGDLARFVRLAESQP